MRALMHVPLNVAIHRAWDYYFHQPKNFKYNLSLTMCVKDESAYILEWLEYHLLQGVDHFYIYNNNGTDNTSELLKPYIQKGIVTWRVFPGMEMQEEIYNDAITHYKNETRWMGFIDCDEFIVPMKHRSLAKALKEYEDFSQILMHWVLYGSSGHKKKTKGFVIERFTKHDSQVNSFTKAILNPRACLYAGVHRSYVLGDTVNEHKKVLNRARYAFTADILRVNHYVIKSAEEYLMKKNRGRAVLTPFDDNFFQAHDRNDVDEPKLMQKYVRQLHKKLQGKA